MRRDNGGQMHTIEGLLAAMVMIVVLIFIIKSTAVTPLSSSTTNKHVQLELMNMGNDLLASLDYNKDSDSYGIASPLNYAILSWNGDLYVWDGKQFNDIDNPFSPTPLDPGFTKALNNTFSQHGIAYDVEVVYLNNTNNVIARKMIWNGDPSDNSVTVSRMMVIHDDDMAGLATIRGVVPDADESTYFYNLVDVRLTLWRM